MTCGVCGKPSTGWFNNLREIQPVCDADGVLWARWEIKDGPHYRCGEHENWGTEPSERLLKRRHRVTQLSKTCGACPAQWEGVAADGSEVCIRYRWGWLTARVGGEVVVSFQTGDEYGGVMDDAQMVLLLATWLDFTEVLW